MWLKREFSFHWISRGDYMFLSKTRLDEIAVDSQTNPNTNDNPQIPICEKYLLTIKEASVYFNIGQKKLYVLAEDNLGRFAINNGNKFLIIRTKFEKFINESSTI